MPENLPIISQTSPSRGGHLKARHKGEVFFVEITEKSYIRIEGAIAREFFPTHYCTIVRKSPEELLIYPAAPGAGVYLKERNNAGDSSVLAIDALGFEHPVGRFEARPSARGLKVSLPASAKPTLPTQPLGIFPLPQGFLLYPDLPDATRVRESLLKGQIPEDFGVLAGHEAAFRGDLDGAREVFARPGALGHRDPLDAYNLWLLDPESASWETIAKELKPYGFDGLVELVAFLTGQVPDLSRLSDANTSGVVAALIRAADIALDEGDPVAQAARLVAAADVSLESPVLAGLFLAEAASLDPQVEHASRALELLEGTDLAEARAEAYLGRSLASHMRGDIRSAMADAQAGLALVDRAANPYLAGRLIAQLGTALLTTVAGSGEESGALRYATAIAHLRQALTLIPEGNEAWNTAAVNLANALVYAPSSEPRSLLIEAVDLYEKVARYRTEAGDEAGLARVRANQGTALGHLGLWEDAQACLQEAAGIFAEAGDDAGLQVTREALANLEKLRQSDAASSAADVTGVDAHVSHHLPTGQAQGGSKASAQPEAASTQAGGLAGTAALADATWQVEGKTPAERLDNIRARAEEIGGAAPGMLSDFEAAFTEVMREGLAPLIRHLKTDERASAMLYEAVEDPATRLALAIAGLIRLPKADVRFGPPDLVRSAWHVARGGSAQAFQALRPGPAGSTAPMSPNPAPARSESDDA